MPVEIEIRKTLVQQVANLEETQVLEQVRNRLELKSDPLEIVQDCIEGLRLVGKRYEERVYYLSGLIMAGEIFREVMELVQPVIQESITGHASGKVLLGTVKGDIHDIGKNNFGMLLGCYGFSVIDIGVDVHPQQFVLHASQVKPDIIGLSGLITSSYDSMRETVQEIRKNLDLDVKRIPVLIGGGVINAEVCQYVGANDWSTDAMTGVRLCQKIMQPKDPLAFS